MEKDKDLSEALDIVKTMVEEDTTADDTAKKEVKKTKESNPKKEEKPAKKTSTRAKAKKKVESKEKTESKPEPETTTEKTKEDNKEDNEDKVKPLKEDKTSSFLSPELIREAKRSKEEFLSLPSSKQREKKERLAPKRQSQEERELMSSMQNDQVLQGLLGLSYMEDNKKESRAVFKIIYGDCLVYIPPKEFLLSSRDLKIPDMHGAVGSVIPFQVIDKLKDDEGNSIYIASRKRALEKKFLEEATMAEKGEVYTGTIISVTKNYFWTECLGLDFKISRYDLDSQRGSDLRNVFNNNDEINLRLVEYSLEDSDFKVSPRSGEVDPKSLFCSYYKRGDIGTGKIIMDPENGYIISLPLGSHHSQLIFCPNESWLENRVSIGDLVNVKITSYYYSKDLKTGNRKFFVRGYIQSLKEKQMPGVF